MSLSDMTHNYGANTLYDAVFGVHSKSNKTFLYTEQGEVSYAAFTGMTNKLAHALSHAGLQAGE
ncbi:MAG: hypothetical protein HN538_04440, partial [Alphaproteobacteria bacterium]|nr:hypothetical protein [Alphaproteobacteria bacterium]